MTEISVEQVSFAYRQGEVVLDNLSLAFSEQSTAIIGGNGAGKTTLVKLLKGLLKPTKGTVSIQGQDTTTVTVASLAERIGLVFQNPDEQIFKSNILAEVMFGPLNLGWSEETAKERAITALNNVGLADQQSENPYDLSLSDRKFIGMAAVLAMNPDIIIFDEPTIAQDFSGREKVKTIIRQLQSEGRLVLTVIHDMDFVAEMFERTVVLHHGNVLTDGDTREVFANEDVLKKAGVALPYVSQLAQSLGMKKTCLTVAEFVAYWQAYRV